MDINFDFDVINKHYEKMNEWDSINYELKSTTDLIEKSSFFRTEQQQKVLGAARCRVNILKELNIKLRESKENVGRLKGTVEKLTDSIREESCMNFLNQINDKIICLENEINKNEQELEKLEHIIIS